MPTLLQGLAGQAEESPEQSAEAPAALPEGKPPKDNDQDAPEGAKQGKNVQHGQYEEQRLPEQQKAARRSG